MRKRLWIVPAVLAGLVAACTFAALSAVPKSAQALEEKKDALVQAAANANGGSFTEAERQLVLSGLEEYIRANRLRLLVARCDRLPDSISVTFFSGAHYLCIPQVPGMK